MKLEATGLRPDTVYWYRFADCSNSESISDTGRTRTLASPDSKCLVCHKIMYALYTQSSSVPRFPLFCVAPANQVNGGKPLTFAVFSCSNYPFGFFNAYAFASHNTSADVFVHLGDYVSRGLQLHSSLFRADINSRLLRSTSMLTACVSI